MIAQISLSDNPCCQFINEIPHWVFLLIHVAIFAVAAVLAVRASGRGDGWLAGGFSALALAEVSYMTYHVNLTLFLFAHTISEVLVLVAILLIAGSTLRRGVAEPSSIDRTGAGQR